MTSAPQAGTEAASIADFTAFFKAFCNSTRAGIVEQLMSGEKCVCEIVAHVGGSQPLVSHHLATLRDAGFVTHARRGRAHLLRHRLAELRRPARLVPRDHSAAAGRGRGPELRLRMSRDDGSRRHGRRHA